MVNPVNISAIETATGTSWKEWCAQLDAAGAAELDHNAIVHKARSLRDVSGWWAQSVAVAYEQHIGRRRPGQTSNGLFSVSVSRTVVGPLSHVHSSWSNLSSDLSTIGDRVMAEKPTVSETPKRLYWRCKFQDKSSVSIGMEAKAHGKVLVAVVHKNLLVHSDIKEAKLAWVSLLDGCFPKE